MSRFREHVWFHLRDLPLFLWRDSSVQHFDTGNGDYHWPTRTNSCVPFRDIALDDRNQLQSWNPWLSVSHLPRFAHTASSHTNVRALAVANRMRSETAHCELLLSMISFLSIAPRQES